MYINEIDEILEQTLDKFLYLWVTVPDKTNKLIDYETIVKDSTLNKHFLEIGKLLEFGMELISENDINAIVTKNENVILIKELVKKYLFYYFFILIGTNKNIKIEVYNNSLIEFSKNQKNNVLKSDNFFSSESNSTVIKTIYLVREFVDYINKTKSNKKNENLLNNYSNNLREFITLCGEEQINAFIEFTDNSAYSENKIQLDHAIAKLFVIKTLYKQDEKNEVFNTIEAGELSTNEFIFIDIVVPRNVFIDYEQILSVLDVKDLKTSTPDYAFKLLNENYVDTLSEEKKYFTNYDDKIQKLFESKHVIPIVDDFLLYHKDNEKYEKQSDDIEFTKKKEDTKIKYIVGKINTMIDLYKNPVEIGKLFNVQFKARNALLVNAYEDMKILSKMKNAVKLDFDNNEDLKLYRMYPYISFSDFKKNGFYFTSETTIDVVRSVNFEYKKKASNSIQTRIISSKMISNIVGYMVLAKNEYLECVDVSKCIDVNDVHKNSLTGVKTLIDNNIKNDILKTKNEITSNYYWLFDAEKDNYNIPFYDISQRMSKNEVIKIVSTHLYENIIETVLNSTTELIKSSDMNIIEDYYKIISKMINKYNDIENMNNSEIINNLIYIIYHIKTNKSEDVYDFKEDIVYGLSEDTLTLPTTTKKKINPMPVLKILFSFESDDKKSKNIIKNKNIDYITDELEYETTEYIEGVCQHVISWDNISEKKRFNLSAFSKNVYEFIQQFVKTNVNGDYVCKSCGTIVDIKNYVVDGKYDDNSQTFVTFTMMTDVDITDLPEYEKYKSSIFNIDKLMNKMMDILTESSKDANSNRTSKKSVKNGIIKNSVDLIINHNIYIKEKYWGQTRNMCVEKWGINKNLSNLFFFELTNDIFTYSSKDKDMHKIVKFNNVVTYILLLLILDFNETQIINLKNDTSICSYSIFKKIGYGLFETMQIYVNKSHDTKPIKFYPILCYIIYLTSCAITKYKLWSFYSNTGSSDNTVKNVNNVDKAQEQKKFDPLIQKQIITTIIELLNTVLKVDIDETKKKKVYLYEIISTKFYSKLDLYKNVKVLKTLDDKYINPSMKLLKETQIDSDKFDILPYQWEQSIELKNISKYDMERYVTYEHNIVKRDYIYNNVNNLTSCLNGYFHNWKINKNTFTCSTCSTTIGVSNYDEKSTKIIEENEKMLLFNKMSKKYCINGKIHRFTKNDICSLCHHKKNEKNEYKKDELQSMYNIIQNHIKTKNEFIEEQLNSLKEQSKTQFDTVKKTFDKILYKFQKVDNSVLNSLNILLDSVQQVLGSDIMIDNVSHNLHEDMYIIDHDHEGNTLDELIIINEQNARLRIIENQTFFKCDVLVYNDKNTKYETYYDMYEKNLLGYRETNKNFVLLKNKEKKIKVVPSIKNMFLLIGFSKKYISFKDYYPELYGYSADELIEFFSLSKDKDITGYIINKIAHKRFNIIKQFGDLLNIYVSRFNNKYIVKIIEQINVFDKKSVIIDAINNPFDIIYSKFFKFLDKITVNKDKQTFLKHFTNIQLYLGYKNITEKIDSDKHINYNAVLKYDFSSNVVLNYLIDEINRLLSYNENKIVKTNIILFIIEMIWNLFKMTNYDQIFDDKHLEHYKQTLYTSSFYLETQQDDAGTSNDFYDVVEDDETLAKAERKIIKNKLLDDEEEFDAVDNGDESEDDVRDNEEE